MEIQQLKRFLVVAEINNLHAAAVQLNITQPALSQSIKKLEESIGEALFLRGARGVELTDAGRILIPRAKLILKSRDHFGRDIEEFRRRRESCVSVGVAPYFSRNIFIQAVTRFARCMPDVSIDIVEGQTLDLVKLIEVGEIEMAFCGMNSGVELRDILEVEPIYRADYSLFARADHPVFKGLKPELANLNKYPWAVHGRDSNGKYFEQIFSDFGLDPPVFNVSTNSLQIIISLVCNSDCIALLAQDSVSLEGHLGLIKKINIPQINIQTVGGIYTLAHAPRSRALTTLIQDLRSIAREHDEKQNVVEMKAAKAARRAGQAKVN